MNETFHGMNLKWITLLSKSGYEWNPPWYEPEVDYTIKVAMNENPPGYEPEVDYTIKAAMNEDPPWYEPEVDYTIKAAMNENPPWCCLRQSFL